MTAAKNGVDVRNINNTSTGIVVYDGDNDFTNRWSNCSIALKQSYIDFNKLYIVATDDEGKLVFSCIRKSWEFSQALKIGYRNLLICTNVVS